MGRIYTPVEISFNRNKRITVGLIDTGADETVVSEKLANELGSKFYGTYKAVCASGFTLTGKYADLHVKELRSGKSITLKVGVSDIPFDTDDINDEGLNIILGVDFIQKTGFEIKM
ncbi:MAG: aspartyl protease family protein [Candidatus Aenigmarchaeota archaeon]|nr:aspartyl protease family protein [Candidatus Aenigmarchaeota archaeon]